MCYSALISICKKALFQIEHELKNLSKERNDIDNQLTGITIQKEALQDEVSHVRKEMAELKVQLNKVLTA